MKLIIKIIQIFSSKLVSKIAYKFMSNPRTRKLRKSEEKVLNESSINNIKYLNFEIAKYEWGIENTKIALLVHGWEGQAGNFASVINVLTKNNYKVIAYDAPSHGRSSKGSTNMFQFSDFLETEVLNFEPHLIISHSFGSVNTATLLRKNPSLKIPLWVLVTTPHRFIMRVNEMSNHFGLNSKTKNELIKRIQNDTQENINQLDMAIYCSELINIEKAIIVHSKKDKVLPIEGARNVSKSFNNCSIIELNNLGHYAILWSKELKEIVDKNTTAKNV